MEKSDGAPGMGPFLLVAAAVVAVDQATKVLISSHLSLYETLPVISGFFNITYVTNTGAAFGLLAEAGRWRELFFQVVSVTAMAGLGLYYYTSRGRDLLLFLSTSLILGGAAGNFVDRVRLGHVVDFLDFYAGRYHWPAFNVADCAITIGGLLLALRVFRDADR